MAANQPPSPQHGDRSNLPPKLGKYEIQGVAGSGAMGLVYVGYDPFADRKVAVKVCSSGDDGRTQSRIARKMFFNEAHTAGELDHPNILKVYDAGEQDGEPYIVMEYVEDAKTLKEYCEPQSLLPIPKVAEIVYKCAKALDYAHRRGVIHRDIKPSNIMLTREGDVKIGDFGIAQRAQAETTQVIGMLGSPRYMSPEQAQEDTVTNQTDIYSLGVVMYELLAGRPAFEATGFTRLIYKVLNEAPAPLRALRPEVSERMERIVARAMHKQADRRYAMASEMAAELVDLFEGLQQAHDVEPSDENKFEVVRDLHFFNDFSDAEIWEVIRASLWEHHAPGAEIIHEGRLEHSFYIIVSGEVSVIKNDRELSVLAGGDCFGEMGYLSKIRRTASIVARDDVSLLKINATLMERASITCQLRFNKVFLQTLIDRLARTSELLSQSVP